jgi:hypothetical protein
MLDENYASTIEVLSNAESRVGRLVVNDASLYSLLI